MSYCNDTCQTGYVPGPAPKADCKLSEIKYMLPPNMGVDANGRPIPSTFKTYYLPANMGSDKAGEPNFPCPGAYYSAIVIYGANNHIYIYDSLGVPTLINAQLDGMDIISQKAIMARLDELEKRIKELE